MAPLTPIGIYVPPQLGYTYVVPVNLPASSMPYQEPPPTYRDPAPTHQEPPPPSTYRETPAPQPTILTTARKIIITSLPHPTHRAPLLSLLSTCAGPPIRISSLEIAKHPDGRPKGHAFAVLESHAVAMRVVERINGLRWQGRTLCARLAKEGVEEGEGRTPQLRSLLPDRSRKAYPASSYASSWQRADSEASSQPSEGRGAESSKGPSQRTKEDDREPGSEKKKNSPPSPAVVDGSHSGTARERRKQKQKEI
jgi:hypothetical protein